MRFADRSILALVLAWSAAGCDAQNAAYVVHVDTDAPLALEPGGVLAPGDPEPLFDELFVSVPASGESAHLRVDRAMLRGGGLSFGIYGQSALPPTRIFVGLARHSRRDGRFLDSASGYVNLPSRWTHAAARDVYVQLTVATFGNTHTLPLFDEPQAAMSTWPGAHARPCDGPPRPGEVCVPGGAFWSGDPASTGAMQLARVDPFYLDATEVTVAELRASGLFEENQRASPPKVDPSPPISPSSTCTYSEAPGSPESEARPVTCVTWQTARTYCQRQGKDLATELQLVYAQGGLHSHRYPWGDDEPTCDDAVFARAVKSASGATACSTPDTRQGAAPVGSGRRDRVDVPGPAGGTIFDLAGNVREWGRDPFPMRRCASARWLDEGRCESPAYPTSTDGTKRLAFGGGWASDAARIVAGSSSEIAETEAFGAIGFRCSRALTPP